MTAAMSHKRLGKKPLAIVSLVIVAAVAIGAVLLQRGPDPTLLPEMANQSVALPDGAAIFVQKHEVTIAEWNNCAAQGGCSLTLRPRPDQDAATTPATGLNYLDVQQYVAWISESTGHHFRLPTVTEWNHMAAPVLPKEPDPIFTDPSLTWASAYLLKDQKSRALEPQGSFSTSPAGIVDLDGSVWEWTQDCYAGSNGKFDPSRCPAFFVGGEHLSVMSFLIRDPARGGCAVGAPPAHLGMRLVTDIPL